MSNEKSCASTSINWYPGHMAKTKKQIENDLKLIDVVIELLDSRIPFSSRNPDIKKIIANKKKIIILNKCDLADEATNIKWVKELSKEAPVLLVDSNSGKGIEKVSKEIDKLMEEEIKRQASRGRINKTIRIMILKGKSGPSNTPMSSHCLQNKTQTLPRSMGVAQLVPF